MTMTYLENLMRYIINKPQREASQEVGSRKNNCCPTEREFPHDGIKSREGVWGGVAGGWIDEETTVRTLFSELGDMV